MLQTPSWAAIGVSINASRTATATRLNWHSSLPSDDKDCALLSFSVSLWGVAWVPTERGVWVKLYKCHRQTSPMSFYFGIPKPNTWLDSLLWNTIFNLPTWARYQFTEIGLARKEPPATDAILWKASVPELQVQNAAADVSALESAVFSVHRWSWEDQNHLEFSNHPHTNTTKI